MTLTTQENTFLGSPEVGKCGRSAAEDNNTNDDAVLANVLFLTAQTHISACFNFPVKLEEPFSYRSVHTAHTTDLADFEVIFISRRTFPSLFWSKSIILSAS